MNPRNLSKKMGKGCIPLEERYETSEKMPEPKFDILQEQQYLERGEQRLKDLEELKRLAFVEKKEGARAEYRRNSHTGNERYMFNIMDNHRAQMVNWNAHEGRKKAELERWRDENPSVSTDEYKKVKDNILSDIKANAIWAGKEVVRRQQLQKERAAKKRRVRNNKMTTPKGGALNAAMRKIKKG